MWSPRFNADIIPGPVVLAVKLCVYYGLVAPSDLPQPSPHEPAVPLNTKPPVVRTPAAKRASVPGSGRGYDLMISHSTTCLVMTPVSSPPPVPGQVASARRRRGGTRPAL